MPAHALVGQLLASNSGCASSAMQPLPLPLSPAHRHTSNNENFRHHPLPPSLATSLQPPPLIWIHRSHRHHERYQHIEGISQIPSRCAATAQSFRQLNFGSGAPPLLASPPINQQPFHPERPPKSMRHVYSMKVALSVSFLSHLCLVDCWYFDGFQLRSLCPHRELLISWPTDHLHPNWCCPQLARR
jgi:hypothetical protein